MNEIDKTIKDSLVTGEGFMLDGKRVDPTKVYKSHEDLIIEAADELARIVKERLDCGPETHYKDILKALAAYEKARGK